jgi:hypothetical protein
MMKTFLVRSKGLGPRHVRAVSYEMHGEHLVFLSPNGKLAALFMMEFVESFCEI